jgi:hypothetical protein
MDEKKKPIQTKEGGESIFENGLFGQPETRNQTNLNDPRNMTQTSINPDTSQ